MIAYSLPVFVAHAPPLPFVGRGEESAALDDALAAAGFGEVVTMLVSGEAGIGKTALLRELAGRASHAGVAVHWGNCRELGESPPFWPWIQVMRSMGEGDVGGVALEHQPNDPFAMIDGLTETLRLRSDSTRLIVLDDLHAADLGSLELLRFLTSSRLMVPLMIAGTQDLRSLRDDPERDVILGEVARDARKLVLTELGNGDITALVRARLSTRNDAGGQPTAHQIDAVATTVTDRSGGNPLYARALIESLSSPNTSGMEGLPAGIRAAVRARLAPLPAAVRRLLGVAAVLADAVTVTVLAVVAERPLEDVDEDLAAAAAAGLVEYDGDQFRFQHKLIRDTLVDEVGAAARRRLHLRMAHQIEQLGSSQVPDVSRSSLVAQHLVSAGELAEPEEVAAWLHRAVHDARLVRAHGDAINWGTLAATYWHRVGDAARESEALAGVVADHLAVGAGDAAVAKVAELAALARQLDDAGLLAGAALARAEVFDPDVDLGGVALLREALDHPGNAAPSETRARLLGELAALVGMPSIDGVPRDQPLARRALAELESIAADGSPAVPAVLATARLNVESGPATFYDRRRWFAEGVGAERSPRMLDRLRLAYWAASLAFEEGDLAAVEAHLSAWTNLADRGDSAFWRWRAATAQASLWYLRGRFDEAEKMALDALPLVSNLYPAMAFRVYAGLLFAIRRDQGRLAELADELAELAAKRVGFAGHLDGHGLAILVPVVALETGDVDLARQSLGAVVAAADEATPGDLHWLCLMSVLAVCAAGVGDAALCRRVAAAMSPYAEQSIMWGRSYVPGGPVSLAVGLAERGGSNRDAAAASFRRALAWANTMHAPAFGARARVGLASMLDADDPARGELLEAAHRTAVELGMAGLADEATALGLAHHDRTDAVAAAPPLCRIRVLGRFEVAGPGAAHPSRWSSRKARDALKILVCQRGRSMPREQLIDLLWPDADVVSGRSRLSVVLSMVRAALDPDRLLAVDPMRADRQAVSLDLGVVDVDAERFLQAAAQGRKALRLGQHGEARRLLRSAVEAAASHQALAEDPYADWSAAFRLEVERTYRDTIRSLALLADDAGDYDESVEWHARAVELDPDDDDASDELVRALRRAGRPHDADAHRRARTARRVTASADDEPS